MASKKVNDSLGHEAGDHLLRDVAERLKACVREEDTIARLGGDEFTVILTGAKQCDDVEIVAQGIIDAVAMPFHVAKQLVQVSASIGGAFYPHDASSPDALLKAADQAMYKAKKSGANQMCFYDTFDKPDEYASRVDDQGS
jgi:diguanylate cyclase (GGDEF)-like protein